MIQTSPEAIFDVLKISHELRDDYPSLSLAEFHAITYLACLLWVYHGSPANSWGYGFIESDGYPFAASSLDATSRLTRVGQLSRDGEGAYELTTKGAQTLIQLQEMSRFASRLNPLESAAGAARALPLPAVRAGISREPQLARIAARSLPRNLLDEMGLSILYDDFVVLERELGKGIDLIVPAVVWLSFLLSEEGSRELNGDL